MQILDVVDQIFSRTKHFAQLDVIESHLGMALAVVSDWRVDKIFVGVWSCISAHTGLEATCILRACVINHILHL